MWSAHRENSGCTSSAHWLLVVLQKIFFPNKKHQSVKKKKRRRMKYLKQNAYFAEAACYGVQTKKVNVFALPLNNTHKLAGRRKKKKKLQINSSERLKQHWCSKERGRKKGRVKLWLGVLQGVDIFPDLRILIMWRREELQPDTAQPGDPMPIGAWPFSRTLCQRCQFDGRWRRKWHFSRVGKRGQKCKTSQVVKEKEAKKHRKHP